VRAVIAVYLLLPQIPMLFMGEEFGASQPFPFFAHFEPELAEAVREGRRAEFAKFPEFQDPHKREKIPDPTSEHTFLSAKLNWSEIEISRHAEWAALYRELLRIRHSEIIPRLKGILGGSGSYEVLGDGAVSVQWTLGDGTFLRLTANFSSQPINSINPDGRRLWSTGIRGDDILDPWGAIWSLTGTESLGGRRHA
jgi:maltooligosyltrehalose trehalohydrolase